MGNRYVDYVGSWGPLFSGHCHPTVVAAVTAAVKTGQLVWRRPHAA